MKNLEDLVREHYRREALPADRVDDLVGLARLHRRVRRQRWAAGLALAAAAAAFVLMMITPEQVQERTIADLVVREIAMNHRADLDLEFVATDLSALARHMDRLDFEVAAVPETEPYALLGGRYCSLRGVLAMQSRFRDPKNGGLVTVYATDLTPELAGLAPSERLHEGLRIRFMARDGVFYALAEAHPGGA